MRDTATRNETDETEATQENSRIGTAGELLLVLQEEGIIGMWKDRDDIGDSGEFARKLRDSTWRRGPA